MLSSKIDTLLAFQPPARELLQQKDIHITAKKYYDFFGFTDNAIVFLKRYITENFNFLSYYDQSSVLLIQTCHNFHAAWPKLHKDPSPLISVLLTQLQNTLALASSISPLDFKLEDEARETFSVKVNAVKDIQISVDKKFQTLWKQCHMQTTTYYQKLEEYKEQKEKVRQEYEQYEKQTRDSKGYNVTLVQELEAKLNEKTLAFIKTKDAFERVCADSQESYNAVLNFFETNRGLIEDFLKMFMRTLMEMTVFLVERMQQNFMFLKQKTGELHQTIKSLNLRASLEAEENFMKAFCMNPRQQLGQVKEMNRLNYRRQEFVNAMGFFSQESLHICQDAIEKFTYFEEVETFKDFFAQFDAKIALNLVPFTDFLKELKSLLISLFTHEKTNNEQMTQKLASQRLKAYSALVNALTRSHRHSHQPSQINLEQDSYLDDASVKKAFAEFLKTDENLAQDLVKDLDRLYNAMSQEVWTKIIQSCQKVMVGLKDKLKEDKLTVEVQRIQGSLIQALGHTENIETLETKRNAKKVLTARDRSTSVPEECAVIAEERLETWSNKINKYNRSEFKFITEKKAESLAEYIKRQNEERLKEINPNPYTVEFEKGKMSVSTYSDEAVLDSFACAFVENMLLQGRMYITSTKIVFKSYFNGRTLFGSTMLFVPLKEIIQVEKKKNSLGIENMIEIATRKGNLVFTSFVFRDKAFELIQKILNTLHPGYARNFNRGQSIPNFGEALDEEFEENMQIEQAGSGKKKVNKKISKEQRIQFEFMKRQKELKKVMPPIEKYDQVGYKFQYPVDLNTFFRVMLCKSPLTYKGKNYSCCWEIFEEQQNTSDLTVEEWNQELPKDITKKKHLIINNGCFERNCHGTKNLAIPVPFVPKSFRFIQPNKLYLVNEKEAVCVLEVDSKDKIPLSDTFKFRTCYVLRDETGPDGKPMVSMSFNYYVEWFKSTMLKAILLKAAREEITGTGAKLNTVITELIKDGVFEKKKQELAKENCEEESEEEEEEESNGGEGIDIDVNDVVESTETSETRVIKEDEKVVSETVVVGTQQVSEFKVTKRILMIYFSVSLMLCIFIFMRNLYKV